MIKKILLLNLLLHLNLAAVTTQEIVNETSKPMLCIGSYPRQYKEEEIYGILQRVQTQKHEEIIKVIQPNESFLSDREGHVKCYNELMKITHSNRSLQKTDERTLHSHIIQHEMFDISSYANENRTFVDTKYGISQQCQAYQNGQYCKKANGLDIFFNKDERVEKIFLYGNALKNGQLPFIPESFNKIQVHNEPLGLWVSSKNRKLVSKKPSLQSSNVIIWENPSKDIKKIVMTPKNGFLNFNRFGRHQGKITQLQEYLQAIEIEYVMDNKAYALHQKNRPMPVNNQMNFHHNTLPVKKFPRKAKSTWGKYLNPKNEVPTNKFKAFYINTNQPRKVIASEIVDKVSINYAWDKFHSIKSEDFGGYWVGNFIYTKDSSIDISISQSWAKTRIIIDGTVIYEGGNNTKVPYTFTKGKHKIEVEYVNNWHTTGFMVTIKEKEKIHTHDEIRKILSKQTSKNSEVIYAGVYESSNKDQNIELILVKNKKPVILVLSAYDAVNWVIKNTKNTKIEAIVYGSSRPGSEISGDLPKDVPILAYKGRIGSYKMKKDCMCVNGGADFHCEGSSADETIKRIESVTGKKVFGYSGKYGTDALLVPKTILTEKKKKEFKNELNEIERQRTECGKKQNPEFEQMFDQ